VSSSSLACDEYTWACIDSRCNRPEREQSQTADLVTEAKVYTEAITRLVGAA
jgi:hypothetical protein